MQGAKPLAWNNLGLPFPGGEGAGGWGQNTLRFSPGAPPRHPGGRSLRFGARGRGIGCLQVSPCRSGSAQGCKGRSPLHEITLVSPSPEGKGQGDGDKTPLGFRRGLSPGGADSTLDIPFLSALARFTQFKSTSSQYKFKKSSGGLGDSFKSPPASLQRFSRVSPPPRLQRFSFSGRWCRLWYRPA